jgi:hypothetical protein
MEKKKHKSGSLKCKERQEAERQESAKRCRSITDFIIPQPSSTSMYSFATNNQEARNNTHGDDAMNSSGFIVPVSVLPVVATSENIASTSYMESDIPSGINDLVSEAHPINEPTQENKRSTAGIFQYPSRANLKQCFAEHPFQPLEDLPFDARLYERKIMNDSVPRKWLTYNKENRCLYCSCCLAFESPNTFNPSPFVRGFSDYRRISQSLALHKSTTTHVRNVQQFISVVNGGTLDNSFASSLIKKKEEVLKQRSIVMRIIDIIKMLGKQALPFRGHRN